MAQYSKFKTGEFKRNYSEMTPARIKLLIKPAFEHADCDSMHSRLSKKGIESLKEDIKAIERSKGIRESMNHHAITKQSEKVFKC